MAAKGQYRQWVEKCRQKKYKKKIISKGIKRKYSFLTTGPKCLLGSQPLTSCSSCWQCAEEWVVMVGRDILHRISAMVLEKDEEEIKRECPRNTTPSDTYGMDFLQLDWNTPAIKRRSAGFLRSSPGPSIKKQSCARWSRVPLARNTSSVPTPSLVFQSGRWNVNM